MAQKPELAIIVPARLKSSRFPRKLLHSIQGRSLVIHVAERIRGQVPDIPLIFAVDDKELQDELQKYGFESLMTAKDHASGTDRLAEANRLIGAKYVINIQGDEPLVTESQIRQLTGLVVADAPMATLATVFLNSKDFSNPNQVKVVVDKNSMALYFSRAAIPYFQESQGNPSENDLVHHLCFRHLGMYAYRAEFLEIFASMPKGKLEQLERLEQLRVLENGHKIAVGITSDPSISIDTQEDAEQFEALL